MIETLRNIDNAAFYFINHSLANPVMDAVCPWLREKLTWVPLYMVIAFIVFRKYGFRITLLLGAFAALTILMSDQCSDFVKYYIHRLRPCNSPELQGRVRLLLSTCGNGFSFVSAHAANHFALATFFAFLAQGRRPVIFGLYIWAACVAFSQVYVGVHFPADVIGGGILGVICGFITGKIVQRFISFEPQA